MKNKVINLILNEKLKPYFLSFLNANLTFNKKVLEIEDCTKSEHLNNKELLCEYYSAYHVLMDELKKHLSEEIAYNALVYGSNHYLQSICGEQFSGDKLELEVLKSLTDKHCK